MQRWKIVASGEGGQGVQALAETLALAAHRGGLNALYIPNFGIEQRGGVSLALVQLSRAAIGAPKFRKAGLVVALSLRSLERCRQYYTSSTMTLYDSSLMEAPQVADQVVGLQSYDTSAPEAFAERPGYRAAPEQDTSFLPPRLLALPAADLARRRLHQRVFNMIVLGGVAALVQEVSVEQIKEALEIKLSRRFTRDPSLRKHNFEALDLGYALVREELAKTSREEEAVR